MKPVTLITGASAGIGADLARVFAAHGHELVLVARREDRLNALADEIAAARRPRPAVLALDLERRDAVATLAAELTARGLEPAERGQQCRLRVERAGRGARSRRTAGHDRSQYARAHRTVARFCRQPGAPSRRHSQRRLVAAFLPGPGMAVYYASKAYVLSFSEALHRELAGRGMRVTALCPGPVPTEFQARARHAAAERCRTCSSCRRARGANRL